MIAKGTSITNHGPGTTGAHVEQQHSQLQQHSKLQQGHNSPSVKGPIHTENEAFPHIYHTSPQQKLNPHFKYSRPPWYSQSSNYYPYDTIPARGEGQTEST